MERPGVVYVLQHSTWDAVKVGRRKRRRTSAGVAPARRLDRGLGLGGDARRGRVRRERELERGAPEGTDGWSETASVWDADPYALAVSLGRREGRKDAGVWGDMLIAAPEGQAEATDARIWAIGVIESQEYHYTRYRTDDGPGAC